MIATACPVACPRPAAGAAASRLALELPLAIGRPCAGPRWPVNRPKALLYSMRFPARPPALWRSGSQWTNTGEQLSPHETRGARDEAVAVSTRVQGRAAGAGRKTHYPSRKPADPTRASLPETPKSRPGPPRPPTVVLLSAEPPAPGTARASGRWGKCVTFPLSSGIPRTFRVHVEQVKTGFVLSRMQHLKIFPPSAQILPDKCSYRSYHGDFAADEWAS